MARYNELKAAIEAAIYENEEQEITGDILQNVLKFMVDALGAGHQFIGVAHSDTEPGTPDQRVFYLAAPGTYPGFGFTVPEGSLGAFVFEASWSMETIATGVPAGAVRYDVLQTLTEQMQARARQNIGAASESDLEDKQDVIEDLEEIREGAAAGATAVQPEAIADMETQTHAAQTYATKEELAMKQDAIGDLTTIRNNAAAGKTASDNLGGHTVDKNVPANAVFTDTVYDDTEVKEAIAGIEALIPAQASEDNQLADKAFVNSTVGTNTANYISDDGQPFTSADDLPTTGVTNNDYAFVTGTDSEGNVFYDRYKATVSGASVTWAKEYRLNNSSFTAAQWAAIQSGITALLVQAYNAHLASENNPHNVTKAQVGLGNVDNTSDADKPVSNATQQALNALQSALNGKADTDGNYPDMQVGKADTLVGKGIATAEELLYSRTGLNQDVATGVATLKDVKGKSIVWNQLIRPGDLAPTQTVSGVTITNNGDGSITVVGTATDRISIYLIEITRIFANSTFIARGCPKGGSPDTYYLDTAGFRDYGAGVKGSYGNYGATIALIIQAGTFMDNITFVPQVYKLYDTSITLAEFKALFPNAYYAHNAGTLLSLTATGVKTTGLNQFDGTKAQVIGGQTYYVKGTYSTLKYARTIDGEQTDVIPDSAHLFTLADNGYVFATGTSADFCIHFSYQDTTRNDVYEPYESHTLQLPVSTLKGKLNGQGASVTIFPDGMRSAGSAYDELVVENGMIVKAIKRIGSVDLGTLNWAAAATIDSDKKRMFASLNGIRHSASILEKGNLICANYDVTTANNTFYAIRGISDSGRSTDLHIYVYDDAYNQADSPAAFKAAMNGVMLNYELATYEEYILDTQIPATLIVNDMGTTQVLPENGSEPTTAPIRWDIVYNPALQEQVARLPYIYVNNADYRQTIENIAGAVAVATGKAVAVTWNGNVASFNVTELTE